MRKWSLLAGIIFVAAVLIGCSISAYMDNLDYLSKTMHETDRWAVIKDSKGDIMAVETTNDKVWNTIHGLRKNQTSMWIGGIIDEYGNKWGFRFKPETIIIAQITIEGAQSTIKSIGEDLDYWMNVWTKETYVLARVTEINE